MASVIKPPAGEGSVACHASSSATCGDDAPVNTGNTFRFRRRFEQGFFPLAPSGNGILAIFAAGL